MKISPHFFLQEFVPANIFKKWDKKSFWFIDKRIIDIAESIRNHIRKPVIINNWKDGGAYNYSGYRPPECNVGARFSQHRLGRAIDIKVPGIDLLQLYSFIKKNSDKFPDITCLENIQHTNTWIHADCRFTGENSILIINP